MVNSVLIGCILGLCTWPCYGCVSGSQSTCKDLIVGCLFLLQCCETGYKSSPNVPGKTPKLFPLQLSLNRTSFVFFFAFSVIWSSEAHNPIQVNDSLGPWIRVTDFFQRPWNLKKREKRLTLFALVTTVSVNFEVSFPTVVFQFGLKSVFQLSFSCLLNMWAAVVRRAIRSVSSSIHTTTGEWFPARLWYFHNTTF